MNRGNSPGVISTEPGAIRFTLAGLALKTAGGLIAWFMTVYTISLSSLLLGQGIWRYTAAISLLAIPLWVFLVRARGAPRAWLSSAFATLFAFAVLLLGFWFTADYYDFSWDGAAYHQEAIIQMAQGWHDFPTELPETVKHHGRIDTYPKAPWVISASIYKATSSLDGAKLVNFALFAIAFLLLIGALLRESRIPLWASLLVAAAAALNPVTIYQSLSFYVDGQLASLLVALTAVILLLLNGPRWHYLLLLAALIILIINTKQTGVAYAGLFVIALLTMLFFQSREWFTRTLIAAVTGGLLGALLFGYSPYVTNTLSYGNPFYPVIWVEDRDFEKGHRPAGFDERSGVVRLALSTFSESSVAKNAPVNLRAPFTNPGLQSIAHFRGADIRLGGWGVLFSSALVLGLAGLLLVGRVPRGPRTVGLVLLGTVALSVLINPEAWWARFAPQWCLVALIPGAMLLFEEKHWIRAGGLLIIFVLLVNSALVAYAYYPSQKEVTVMIREHLQEIARQQEPIVINFGTFRSNRIRLQEAGIEFEEVDRRAKLRCRNPHRVFVFQGAFCFSNEW